MPDEVQVWIATLLPKAGTTGVQTHMNHVADWLRTSGLSHEWVTPYVLPRSLARRGVNFVGKIVKALSPVAGIVWHRFWLARDMRACLSWRGRDHRGGVVILAQDPLSALVCKRWAVAQDKRIRLVAVCHFNGRERDEWSLSGIPVERWQIGSRLDRLERAALEGAHTVVSPSEWLRKELIARYPNIKERVTVLPNAVNTCRELERGAPEFDLITIGSLEPRKNHKLLILIVAELVARGLRVKFGIVGDGPLRADLEALVERLGLVSAVRFIGRQDDVFRYLAVSRVYAHAAKLENLPLSILEAAAAGLPIVTTPSGGAREIVRNGVDGLYLEPDDVATSSDCVEELLLNENLARSMGMAARRRCEVMYSDRVVRRRFDDLITEEIEALQRSAGQ